MGDTVLSNAVFISGLPVLSNLKLHLDASLVSKEDSAAVRSEITSGSGVTVQRDYVLKWNDLSGNANNATQGASNLQPELIEMKMGEFTFGERDYETYSKFVRFDGTKAMTVAQSTSLNGLNNLTVVVVARSTSKVTQKTILSKIGTGTVGWFVGWNSANQLGWYIRNGGTTNTLSAATDVGLDGGWHILTGSASSTSVTFQTDAIAASSMTRTVGSSLTNTSPISIGYNGSSSLSTVDVAEVLIYDGVLSATDMESVQSYLRNKYQPTPPVTSIYALKPVTDTVALGETYVMPSTMQAYMTNGTVREVAVNWSPTSIDTSTLGTKTSTATAVSDSTKSTTLTVEVQGIHSLDNLTYTVERGSTFTMPSTAVANLGDANGPKRDVAVTWNGTVDTGSVGTFQRIGTAVLDSTKSMTLTVIVIPRKVSSVTLDTHSGTLNIGNTLQLTATVLPTDAAIKTVGWRSNDTTVATVSATGLVTAVGSGTASIIVTTVDGGLTDVCAVMVNVPVSSVSLNKTAITLDHSDTITLVATVLPSNATNKVVVWTSSDTAVATVTSAGLVTVKSNATYGHATVITATSIDGGRTATCTVTAGIPVTSVSLNKNSRTIEKGSTYDLNQTVYPSTATVRTVTWSSSNTAVATVSGTGLVSAVGGGTAVITVTTDDGGFTAICNVTVTVQVTGVSLSPTSITLPRNGTIDLTETVSPSDATDKTVTYSSSNPSAVSVDSVTGLVRVLTSSYPTRVTITVETTDGSYTATCSVTAGIVVTGITVSPTTQTLAKGANFTIADTFVPSNATNQNVTWSSSDTAVATVSTSGKVTGVSGGTATITVRTQEGGFTATCLVTVNVPVTGVTLNVSTLLLDRGATYSLVDTVAPTDATNKNVTWTSSNQAVATVDGNGVVTVKDSAPFGGTTTITVTTVDGGRTDSCDITVRSPVTSVTLTPTTLTLVQGNTSNLTDTVYPANATNPNVTWRSSNPAVVSVSSSGTVTAVSGGTATITVTTVDGGHTATCEVTVPLYAKTISSGSSKSFTVTFNKSMLGATLSGSTIVISGNQITFSQSSNYSSDTNISILVVASDGTTKTIVVWRTKGTSNWTIVTH
jgi:uncharacterized protein YjdB